MKEEITSFAPGHLALGYICSKLSSKLLKVEVNLPLIFLFSVLPDIDIIIPQLNHRGPTHSIIVAFLFFIPFLIVYSKKSVPYLIALVQHSTIGDFFAGKTQILWPISMRYYGMDIPIDSPTNITVEWICFLISIIIMVKSNDLRKLFGKMNNLNLVLFIPTTAIFLPTLFSFPLKVPIEHLFPHIAYAAIFTTLIVKGLYEINIAKK